MRIAQALVWSVALLVSITSAQQGDTGAKDSAQSKKVSTRVADGSHFMADLGALARKPHRLSGSPEGIETANYIEQALRKRGVGELYVLEMPVFYPERLRCEMEVGTTKVDLYPLAPNITVSPVTKGEGLTGPMRYVKGKEPGDLDNTIAVMNYDCGELWRNPFRMGAKAVVFLGDKESTTWQTKTILNPANILRFYASPEAQEKVDFKQDHKDVRIRSAVPWRRSVGRNIVGVIRGTDPSFARDDGQREALVISAHFDSYGEVPHLTPSARSAANVAAVLEAVEYFKANRPKRDIIFMFVDNHTQYHQGAYAVYEALTRDENFAEKLEEEHRKELEYLNSAFAKLEGQVEAGRESIDSDLVRLLMEKAENARNDHKQILAKIRFDLGAIEDKVRKNNGEIDPGLAVRRNDLTERRNTRDKEVARWDMVLKALAKNNLVGVDEETIGQLKEKTEEDILYRTMELKQAIKIDEQEKTLREGVGDPYIVLHVAYNFSDRGPTWGPVVGDLTEAAYVGDVRKATWDNPGHYAHVMRAIREALDETPQAKSIERNVLNDATMTSEYVPGMYTASNFAAGTFGYYNLSFMTYHDARLRDAHPADNLENLNWQKLRAQAKQGTHLLHRLSNIQATSLPPAFNNVSISQKPKLPRWSGGKSSGFSADIMVSGSLAENRPARGALIAIFPVSLNAIITNNNLKPLPEYKIPGFRRFVLEPVDGNGKFKLTGVNRDLFKVSTRNLSLIAAMFDSVGEVSAFVTRNTSNNIDRLKLFPARGYVVSYPLYGKLQTAADTKVLQASANAPFRQEKSFYGFAEDFVSFYVHRYSSESAAKVFQPLGAVFLGASEKNPYGNGFPLQTFAYPPAVDRVTAEDLWSLNETRLSLVRSKGVTDVDLEVLHNRAKQLEENAEKADNLTDKQTHYAQSASVSRLVYEPVKMLMNDLIRAVVILLLLAIPFAFGLERLLICASTVYGRLGGFILFFALTFTALYFMHPGFSIAATPLIVFLAFAIIVLTSLVIYIMMRKFRTELMAFQGKVTSMHNVEISRMGTMIAAVNMGMSTMRRRPMRTALTCITVIMLTFTVLVFASLTSSVGVRSFYVGSPAGDIPASFLIHNLDYSRLQPDITQLIEGREGDDGLIAEQWWKVRARLTEAPIGIARTRTGAASTVDAVMGVDSRELPLWKSLAGALEHDNLDQLTTDLRNGGIFLPLVIREQLSLERGDSVYISGRKAFFAGAFDVGKIQDLKHLDGRSILPVDFRDENYNRASQEAKSTVGGVQGGGESAQRDFSRLNANQLAIASDSLVRELTGTLHTISVYPDLAIEPEYEGKRFAELANLPVWAKTRDGIQRMIFSRLTEVSGAYALIIPVLLGGFIIFGTLLGSITDRQKEIYTFSALGLSPGHVGFLFLAEAGVYAVIGGLGGQLLAQAIALLASYMADLGMINQPSINFSSTNSIFAIVVVMITVLLSSVYPALRASKSANPGVQRSWKMPVPQDGVLEMTFPFTVSAYDITGVVSFLAEHFNEHGDSGLGNFSAHEVGIKRDPETGNLTLFSLVYLAPFDLGISQYFELTATPSEIPGIDEVSIKADHRSGSLSDWRRSNKVFLKELRRQFLLWRTLTSDAIENYRMQTMELLGEKDAAKNDNA